MQAIDLDNCHKVPYFWVVGLKRYDNLPFDCFLLLLLLLLYIDFIIIFLIFQVKIIKIINIIVVFIFHWGFKLANCEILIILYAGLMFIKLRIESWDVWLIKNQSSIVTHRKFLMRSWERSLVFQILVKSAVLHWNLNLYIFHSNYDLLKQ